jgi:hypothetical protein
MQYTLSVSPLDAWVFDKPFTLYLTSFTADIELKAGLLLRYIFFFRPFDDII